MLKAAIQTGGYGENAILKDIALEVHRGQLMTVVGPNGAGKSTLLKLLGGVLPVQKGEVLVDGIPLSRLQPRERARAIRYLQQNHIPADITAYRLVLHGRFPWMGYPRVYRKVDEQFVEEALKKVGMWDKKDCWMSQLSGGEAQKVYLAMCLAQQTRWVLLDEPVTYLDIGAQHHLLEIIERLKRENKGILMVMHDLGLALSHSDVLAVLDKGQLVFAGPPKEAVESGLLAKTMGIQIRQGTGWIFEKEKAGEESIYGTGL